MASRSAWFLRNLRPLVLLRTSLAAALALVAGCAENGPYFPIDKSPVAINPERTYTRVVVEFGERGSLQVPTQQRALLNVIDGKDPNGKALPGPKRPVFLVTYIHGWHNSAKSSDIDAFEVFLEQLAKSEKIREGNFRVVGAYLAWRGDSVTLPGLKYLSYWNRRGVASEIAGGNDLISTLLLASQRAKTQSGYVAVIGHSFGGLIVERALNHTMLATLSAVSGRGGKTKPNVQLPWDLAVTLNQATNSIRTRQILSTLARLYRYEGNDDGRGKYVTVAGDGDPIPESAPLVIALTSDSDWATRSLLPLGQGFEQATTFGRASDDIQLPHWNNNARPPANAEDGPFVSESVLYRESPGHSASISTHVTKADTAPAPPLLTDGTDAFRENLAGNRPGLQFWTSDRRAKGTAPLISWRIRQRSLEGERQRSGLEAPRVPYWVVRVDPLIIDGHNDIWNPQCRALLAALFRMSHPVGADGVQAPPKQRALPSLATALPATPNNIPLPAPVMKQPAAPPPSTR